jgi:hypothetical protein
MRMRERSVASRTLPILCSGVGGTEASVCLCLSISLCVRAGTPYWLATMMTAVASRIRLPKKMTSKMRMADSSVKNTAARPAPQSVQLSQHGRPCPQRGTRQQLCLSISLSLTTDRQR